MEAFLDFEQPIAQLEKKLIDLKELSKSVDVKDEVRALEKKLEKLTHDTFKKLTSWQQVQLSRHPQRPYALDYIEKIFPDFKELHGDRAFRDDPAIVGGVAQLSGMPLLILANQKGRSTKQKMERNFGMARPEGYRKVIRLLELAKRTRMPILTFIDTPGAYPGADAEARGQSQAIAECIQTWFHLDVPAVSVVIGEGGSGGALAIGLGNTVLMQEYSIYSVISPESCASILWSNSALAEKAAEKLKMEAAECLRLGVIDGIISEPLGGAHRNLEKAAELLKSEIEKSFKSLLKIYEKNPQKIQEQRFQKFRKMGENAIEVVGANK